MRFFRMDCHKIEDGNRVNKTVYLNPSHVHYIESDHRGSKVVTTHESYYTTAHGEHIVEGLDNIDKQNKNLINFN